MPLLKSYLTGNVHPQDRNLLTDIIELGIKTDSALVLDPSAVVAKTEGRIKKLDIDSLLDRIIFPAMLRSIPLPQTATDMLVQATKHQETISSGWHTIDRLLNGGWRVGEVSEVCSSAGTGKTMICLHSTIHLLLQDRSAQVIWIDAHSAGFSAQQASDIARARIQQIADQDWNIEEVISNILSRIQVFVCQDAYEILDAIEAVRKRLLQPIEGSTLMPKLLVVDSLARSMNGILRISDGVGHATMIYTMRELRALAQGHSLAVLVVSSTALLSHSEEQSPSILSTSNVKPGLGSSWKYTTDVQIFVSKIGIGQTRQSYTKRDHTKIDSDLFDESDVDVDPTEKAEAGSGGRSMRVAEIMRSKRLKIGEWCVFELPAVRK
ncbi:DNA repair protein rad51d [Gryganskiella cystojenkinii]|nr:DNA repair protein rad51d [Gryganskiella cystojenkinii]